jgi:peptidoglycan/xylan/chitin deacetylase (PgdA/CDA1 family)
MISGRRAIRAGAVLTTLALLFSLVAQATGSPATPSEPHRAAHLAAAAPSLPFATLSLAPTLSVTPTGSAAANKSSAANTPPPAATTGGATAPATAGGAAAPPSLAAAPPPVTCPLPAAVEQRFAPGRGKTVALTFDDGPGRDTAAILGILARYRVTATFFNLGANEQRQPALVRAELRAGYALGDHTWDHKDLGRLDAAGQASEMDRERDVQHALTGHEPCLLRPPYGSFTPTTLAIARARHLAVWNWSVDTEDWKANGSGAPFWVRRILTRAEAGSMQLHPVILMHNQPGGNPATVAALPAIIERYQRLGYRFVDLLGRSR